MQRAPTGRGATTASPQPRRKRRRGAPAKEIKWVGARQPAWPPSNANGNHGYGTPVVLVGPGVGLEVWKDGPPGNRRLEDQNGIL